MSDLILEVHFLVFIEVIPMASGSALKLEESEKILLLWNLIGGQMHVELDMILIKVSLLIA